MVNGTKLDRNGYVNTFLSTMVDPIEHSHSIWAFLHHYPKALFLCNQRALLCHSMNSEGNKPGR